MATFPFIPGIHHFCDHRCWRCGLTTRCQVYARWAASPAARTTPKTPAARVGATIAISLQVTFDETADMMARSGMAPVSMAPPGDALMKSVALSADSKRIADAECDPLVTRGADYARATWQALQGLRPTLTRIADPAVLDAVERIEEMCITVASKIFRAVSSSIHEDEDEDDGTSGGTAAGTGIDSDANGSAKVALLLIEESRQAWRVLMQPGRAIADGFPAAQVTVLDGLEADLLERFPRALQFVRPGFDTGADAVDNHLIALAILGTRKGES